MPSSPISYPCVMSLYSQYHVIAPLLLQLFVVSLLFLEIYISVKQTDGIVAYQTLLIPLLHQR